MTSNKKTTSLLWCSLVFVFFLATMRCWIGFGGRKLLMVYAFPVVMLGLYFVKQVKYEFRTRYVVFSAIMAISSVFSLKTNMNINGYIFQMWPAISFFFVLSIPDNEKEYVFKKIVKWFGILMMLGIPIYLITQFVRLPGFGTIIAEYNAELVKGECTNYLFYIYHHQLSDGMSFRRFNGPFIEPGDVGCATAFLLMATRFDFKKYRYLWAVLAALVLSLSLAGYMLTFFAYMVKSYYEDKRNFKTITVIFVILLGVYLFGTIYNGGDNIINEKILARLQYDEETGISGYNRTSLLKVEYFMAMFNDPKVMLYGYDQSTIEMLFRYNNGAGIVNKFLTVGIVRVIGLILPFAYFAFSSSSRKYAWMFFVFFLLFYSQRADIWLNYVMSYVYGIRLYEMQKLKQ